MASAVQKPNPHSFAVVLARLEHKGYLSPFQDEPEDEDIPSPSSPVASYKSARRSRTASISSFSSNDSFYTIYDEPIESTATSRGTHEAIEESHLPGLSLRHDAEPISTLSEPTPHTSRVEQISLPGDASIPATPDEGDESRPSTPRAGRKEHDDTGAATPRPVRLAADDTSTPRPPTRESIVDEFTIEESAVEEPLLDADVLNTAFAPRDRSPSPTVATDLTEQPTIPDNDSVADEAELQESTDSPRHLRPNSKDLSQVFEQEPLITQPSPPSPKVTASPTSSGHPDITLPITLPPDSLLDEAQLLEALKESEPVVEPPQESHLTDLRRKLAWRPTAASSAEKAADKRDFTALVLGADDGLADKLFGDDELNPSTTRRGGRSTKLADLRRKLKWRPTAGSTSERAADRRDLDNLMQDIASAPSRSPTKGTFVPASPGLPPPRTSSSRFGRISEEQRPRTAESGMNSPRMLRANTPQQTEPLYSHVDPRPGTAMTTDTAQPAEFYSFSSVSAQGPPPGSSGSMKRFAAYFTSTPAEPEPRASISSTISSDSSSSADSDDAGASPQPRAESPLSDTQSDTTTTRASQDISYKPSFSITSSVADSVISARDLSRRPVQLAARSSPSLHRLAPTRSMPVSNVRSPSIDSAAPPPISLVRADPSDRPGRPLTSKRSGLSSLRGRVFGKAYQPPETKGAAASRKPASPDHAARESELLQHSVSYEAAARGQAPFVSREAASLYPHRRSSSSHGTAKRSKAKDRRRMLGLEVYREHELIEAMSRNSSAPASPYGSSAGGSLYSFDFELAPTPPPAAEWSGPWSQAGASTRDSSESDGRSSAGRSSTGAPDSPHDAAWHAKRLSVLLEEG